MAIWLPNNYRIAWSCNSVLDEPHARGLAQAWADRIGRTFYVPDLGTFSPAGDPPDPDPGPDPEPELDPLVVGDITITGEPVVGYRLTCSEPDIQGGSGDVTVNYYWQDAENNRVLYMGNWHLVTEVDIPRTMCCTVYVVDNQTGENVTVVSNGLGPVARPTLPDHDVWINGELPDDPTAEVGVGISGSVVLEVRPNPTADAPVDLEYRWQIRTGTGRLSGDENGLGVIYLAPDAAPAGALVTCSVVSDDAADNGYAAEVTILVAE